MHVELHLSETGEMCTTQITEQTTEYTGLSLPALPNPLITSPLSPNSTLYFHIWLPIAA